MRGLTVEPDLLLAPLAERITVLAAEERFEEAADVRDRADSLSRALRRQRRFDQVRRAGRVRIDLGDTGGVLLDHGLLVAAWGPGELPGLTGDGAPLDRLLEPPGPAGTLPPVDRESADELDCIAAWLDRAAAGLSVDHCEGVLDSPLPALPSFAPRGGLRD